MKWCPLKPTAAVVMMLGLAVLGGEGASPLARADDETPPEPHSLPELKILPVPQRTLDAKKVALGKVLFFDGRLSGDATLSCATCHRSEKAWTDGQPFSLGYPGSLYFRNTPTLFNVASAKYVFRDGRLPGSDLATVVRDHISEAHFMQADGRLVIERLRQVPQYEADFQDAFGGEPTYGRILGAVAEFVRSLRSTASPLDQYLAGEDTLSAEALAGLEIFRGKGRCIQCHHGNRLTDDGFHNLGLAPNPALLSAPRRHITLRRFFRTLGVANYRQLKQDIGRYAITKQPADMARFLTPSLREVSRTAPYMHDGSLATLDDVVAFYNAGGGPATNKDPMLQPLDLRPEEQSALVQFLNALSSPVAVMEPPTLPKYELRKLGAN